MLLLAGCGGGGSDGSTTIISNPGTGSAVIIVTDAPSDEFAQIWLTVTKVELIGAGGHFTLFEGRREFDLLSLRDDSALLALGRDVPAGDWSKIRLRVDDVELIRVIDADEVVGDEIDCPDGVTAERGLVCEWITPKVGGNGKIDLNPRGPITVRAGEIVFIQLDLDGVKSIHIKETGNQRFQFRPVVFIDAFTFGAPARLVRLEGTIEEIDLDQQRLELCDTHRVFRAEGREDRSPLSGCVDVRIGPDTSIFDADGEPASLADLDEGDELAALGRFRTGSGEALIFDAVWLRELGFDAGTSISGEVLQGVFGGKFFVIAPDPGGPIGIDDELFVALVDGAKIFTREGAPLDPGDLVPGLRVRVFGVLTLSDTQPDLLEASFVFVHEDEPLEARERHRDGGVRSGRRHAHDARPNVDGFVGPLCIALAAGRSGVFRTTERGRWAELRGHRAHRGREVGEAGDRVRPDEPTCLDAAALVRAVGGVGD